MPARALWTHGEVAQALQAAGVTLQDPNSLNVLVGRIGGTFVQARVARRSWAVENAPRYPSRSAICRTAEDIARFCSTLAPPAPGYFDGEQAFRLDRVGAAA